jgi:DNA processing protein
MTRPEAYRDLSGSTPRGASSSARICFPGNQDHRALIALSMVPGIGPGKIRSLIGRFGSGKAVREAPLEALVTVPGIGEATARRIKNHPSDDVVNDQIKRADSIGATLLPFSDAAFPALLRTIYDPPAFLWVRGQVEALRRPCIAVVGARRATEYGLRAARNLAGDLAARGICIVSGLAYGIDVAAHDAALSAGGATIAVLGSGVDRIYPSVHERIARKLLDHGALVSELPLGAEPDAPNFPRRNRLISGLSLGTLVIEALEDGGALITAKLALEQNREVFAVPGRVFDATSTGCHQLIQQGMAKLVRNADDVIEELTGFDAATAPDPVNPEADLSETERLLFGAIGNDARHIDELCGQTGLEPSTALVILLSLEFKGLVRQIGGRHFYREV